MDERLCLFGCDGYQFRCPSYEPIVIKETDILLPIICRNYREIDKDFEKFAMSGEKSCKLVRMLE